MDNVIFLEYYNKNHFPPGKWLKEPDFSKWVHAGLPCLAVRDMSLGVWRGLVGLYKGHLFYNLDINSIMNLHQAIEIFLDVYGGISSAGRLPTKFINMTKYLGSKLDAFWWVGIETTHGGDLMPLLNYEGPEGAIIKGSQSYKDFLFIRQETNKLAKHMAKIK